MLQRVASIKSFMFDRNIQAPQAHKKTLKCVVTVKELLSANVVSALKCFFALGTFQICPLIIADWSFCDTLCSRHSIQQWRKENRRRKLKRKKIGSIERKFRFSMINHQGNCKLTTNAFCMRANRYSRLKLRWTCLARRKKFFNSVTAQHSKWHCLQSVHKANKKTGRRCGRTDYEEQ